MVEKKAIFRDLKTESAIPQTDHSFTVKTLVSNDDLRKKVVLNSQSQANAYSILETIAERCNNSLLKSYIQKKLEYNISVGGKGREDIVLVSKFKTEKEHSWIERILGMAGVK